MARFFFKPIAHRSYVKQNTMQIHSTVSSLSVTFSKLRGGMYSYIAFFSLQMYYSIWYAREISSSYNTARLVWCTIFQVFTYHEVTSSGFPPFTALLSSTSFLYSFCMWRLTACWEEGFVAPPGGAERLPANLDRVLFGAPTLEIPGNFTPK